GRHRGRGDRDPEPGAAAGGDDGRGVRRGDGRARGAVAARPRRPHRVTVGRDASATIHAMAGRALMLRAEPGFSLPAFERFAPPPPPALLAARLDAASAPRHIVL